MLFINNLNTFQGLSTETKPLPPISNIGDKFFETDTQKLYEYSPTGWKGR